jgi:hypothetical protein
LSEVDEVLAPAFRGVDLDQERVDEPDVAAEDQRQVVAGDVDDVAAGVAVAGEVLDRGVSREIRPEHNLRGARCDAEELKRFVSQTWPPSS